MVSRHTDRSLKECVRGRAHKPNLQLPKALVFLWELDRLLRSLFKGTSVCALSFDKRALPSVRSRTAVLTVLNEGWLNFGLHNVQKFLSA